MKDLIAEKTSGLFVEVGKVIEHMKAQQARIADLERQLAEASLPVCLIEPIVMPQKVHVHHIAAIAKCSGIFGLVSMSEIQKFALALLNEFATAAPSAPAVEQQPVAQMICPTCGKDRFKEPCPNMADECSMIADAHLLAAPQAADTDKVREAISKITINPPDYSEYAMDGHEAACHRDGFRFGVKSALKAAVKLVASMAAQAPVERNIHGPLMIARIKRYRDVFGCTLKEAKEAVEFCRDLNSDQTTFIKPPTAQAPVREVPRWKPIETAPKDEHIIGYWRGYKRPCVMWWNFKDNAFESWSDRNEMPSHWMPLPAAPVQEPKP